MKMLSKADAIENRRCALQAALDARKSQIERNKLGQFATPTQLARDMLTFGLSLLPEGESIRFFDPAIGIGSFYSALLATMEHRPLAWARGFEVDPHYELPSRELWSGERLQTTLGDFTLQAAPRAEAERANLLICNPPYVRHHHLSIEEKTRLRAAARSTAGVELSGLAGLYSYFMALSHSWLSEGGVAGWLIPSEFMDVNYGRALKDYLLREVSLLHVHRFDPKNVQFNDALVSSALVWFKKEKPKVDQSVTFSYGGTLLKPSICKRMRLSDLDGAEKWTRFPTRNVEAPHSGYRLGDLFVIKRGIATGCNDFFILSEEKVRALGLPHEFLRPILPSARHIEVNEVNADADGIPILEKRLFLLDCDRPEDELKRNYPTLWAYLQTGIETVASGYLCRSRRFWYAQERRDAAPIVCTYIGRGDRDKQPFRFLLNNSRATATNVYLCLYPQPVLASRLREQPGALRKFWEALNAIGKETMLGNGRVYGGGMHKLEPKELANVPADDLAALVGMPPKLAARQLELEYSVAA